MIGWSTFFWGQDKLIIDSLMTVIESNPSDSCLMSAYYKLGDEYVFNNPDTSAYFTQKSFEIAQERRDTGFIADCYNMLGIIGTIQSKYITGLEHFQSAMKWYELKDDKEGASIIANNIGVIYGYLDDYDQSIQHYKESFALGLENGDSSGCALNLHNIAADFLEKEDFDSVKFYTLALEDFQRDKSEPYWRTDGLWGEIYLHEGNLDSAEAALARYYDLMIEDMDDLQALYILTTLGEVYFEQGRTMKALQTLNKAEKTSLENEFNDNLLDIYELRARIYQAGNEFDKAFESKAAYVQLKDSLDRINNFNRISELNARYASEKKEKELAEMKASMAETEANKKAQDRIYFIVGISLFFILITMVISLIRKKKTNRILNDQNQEINHQRQKILSSINYAKKIQNSILTPEQVIQTYLPDSFVYFKPKDIVSGDFYWFSHQGDSIIIATIDCTGHGVPGAFMSLIANSKLNKVVNELKITEPSDILTAVHKEIVVSLNQSGNSTSAQDGMDMSLCIINTREKTLKYAGAQNPIFIVEGQEIQEIKADNLSIGGTVLSSKLNGSFRFTTKEVTYNEGSHLFMFTDGYIDQFGGDSNKKLNKRKFKSLISDLASKNLQNAKEYVEDYLEAWRGNNPQVDDILIIGAKL